MQDVGLEWGHREGKMPQQHYSEEDERIGDEESKM